MTANQTIDGVPRDLLERCARELSIGIGPAPKNRAQELRALLDAKPETVAGHHPACRAVDDYKPGECSHGCKPAAPTQGEPVAWRWMQAHKNKWEYGSELPVCVIGTWAPLYAEQPAPVAVVMSFDFEHPSSKERRTVALSKQDVFDGMEDYFYDKLGQQICRCESVGETNVVDCNCDEYVHDFEIMQSSLKG